MPRSRDLDRDDEAAQEEAQEEAPFAFEEDLEGVVEASDTDTPDDPNLNLLGAFGSPREWRTMAKHDAATSHIAAGVLAKGRFLGSLMREEYVRNLFLMSRSTLGYGSEQMVRVATRTSPQRPGPIRRFFGLGRKEEGE